MDALTQKLIGLRDRFARLKGDWSEGDHPRADDGKFGSGGGEGDAAEVKAKKDVQASLDKFYGKDPPPEFKFVAGDSGGADPEYDNWSALAIDVLKTDKNHKATVSYVPVWHEDSHSLDLWKVVDGDVKGPAVYFNRKDDDTIKISGTVSMSAGRKTLPADASDEEVKAAVAKLMHVKPKKSSAKAVFPQEGDTLQGKLLNLRDRFRRLLKGGDFNEQDHPRADDGKFGSGGGGADSGKKPAGKKPAAKPAKAPTRTPQEVAAFTAKLKGALDSGALTAAHVPKIAAALGELTLAQLQEVKQAIGIKASGAKAAQATAIAQKALAAVQAKAKPAAPAKPAKPPKADAAKVHAGIADLLAAGEPLNATHVAKISVALQGLTVKEIQAVKAKLGITAHGPKAKLAHSIAAQAVARVQATAKPAAASAAPAAPAATRNPPNHAVPDQGRPPLDAAEVAAVQRYTGSAYRGINASLRRYGTVAGDYTQTHQDLQKAFAKAQPFDKPVDVARGMNMGTADLQAFTAQMQDALNTGSAVKVSGYTSTSTGGIPAGFEGNVEVHIKAKRGLDVAQHSINPEEKELLLNHDSQFKPLSVKRVGHKLIVHMEQV